MEFLIRLYAHYEIDSFNVIPSKYPGTCSICNYSTQCV